MHKDHANKYCITKYYYRIKHSYKNTLAGPSGQGRRRGKCLTALRECRSPTMLLMLLQPGDINVSLQLMFKVSHFMAGPGLRFVEINELKFMLTEKSW